MARRRKEQVEPPGIVVLYTSLMLLLLAFFISINSMSQVEESKVQQARESLSKQFGTTVGDVSIFKGAGSSTSGKIKMPESPMEADYQVIRGIVMDKNQEGDVRLMRSGQKRTLVLPRVLLFPRGSTRLSASGRNFLANIAEIIKGRKYRINIIGHTDDGPSMRPGMDNFMLSAQRAISVLRFLEVQGIKSARLAAIGMAHTKPMHPNDTIGHRLANNRVELVFDASDPSQYLLPGEKQERTLDFKGFIFDLLGEGGED